MRANGLATIATVNLAVLVCAACGEVSAPTHRITATGELTAHFNPATAEPGDEVRLEISLPSISGTNNVTVIVVLSGVGAETDTLSAPSSAPGLEGSFVLPRDITPGELIADVRLPQVGKAAETTLEVAPISGPMLSTTVSQAGDPPMPEMPAGAVILRAGSTVQVHLRARDDRRGLTYVGYRFGPPANVGDSVAVGAGITAIDTTVPLNVPQSLAETAPTLIEFGRNTWGGSTESLLGNAVYAYVARPTNSLALGVTPLDAVEDIKRSMLYVSEPDSSRVAVISTVSPAIQSYIASPYPPADLDLSKSGDTLFVALRGSPNLGIIDLRASIPNVDTLRLQYQWSFVPPNTAPWVEHVRTDAAGRVLVSLSYPDTWSVGTHDRLVLVDFATGIQQLLYGGNGVHDMPIDAAGDRSTMLMPYVDIDMKPLIYSSATGTLSAASPLPVALWQYSGRLSSDAHGQYFLIGAYLFTGSLSLVRQFGITNYTTPTTLLSSNGQDVFASNQSICTKYPGTCDADPSYVLHYAATGQLLELFKVPQWVREQLLLADGHTLVTLGISAVSFTDAAPGWGIALSRTPHPMSAPLLDAFGNKSNAVTRSRSARHQLRVRYSPVYR